MHGVTETRNPEPRAASRLDGHLGGPGQILGAVGAQREREEFRGVAGGAEEHTSRAEQPGGDRALDRLRRAGVGEARGERARREAVIGE